jgi:hypothetical protein
MTLSTSTASEASRRKEEELADWWPERGGRSSGIPTSARKMRLLSKHSLSTSLPFQYNVVSTALHILTKGFKFICLNLKLSCLIRCTVQNNNKASSGKLICRTYKISHIDRWYCI